MRGIVCYIFAHEYNACYSRRKPLRACAHEVAGREGIHLAGDHGGRGDHRHSRCAGRTQDHQPPPDEARVIAARQDLASLSQALKLYRLDNQKYPSTEQGLQALVDKPTTHPVPPNWKSGGYVERLPKDPWGAAYQYLNPGLHGEIDVFSYGADGIRVVKAWMQTSERGILSIRYGTESSSDRFLSRHSRSRGQTLGSRNEFRTCSPIFQNSVTRL